MSRVARRIGSILACLGMGVVFAAPALAQSTGSDSRIALAAELDVLNRYMFRGVRQNSSGLAMWPVAQVGLIPYSGDGGLKRVGVHVRFWNSLHTGDTGSSGPNGKPWYESDFSATLNLGFAGAFGAGVSYTAYVSPNDMFRTAKELSFKVGFDDAARDETTPLTAVKPYGLVAFELNAEDGGQLDGGIRAGRYLEIGISPSYGAARASLSVPLRLGLSIGNYYELADRDNTFGFFSVGGRVMVPLGRSPGAWNVRGGVEIQTLGETTKTFNGGDRSAVVGSFGLGFSY